MQLQRSIELGTGLFVLLGIAALFFLTTQTTNISAYTSGDSYTVSARFSNIGDLKERAPVTIAGVTIGRVTGIRFDTKRLDAVVTMRIGAQYDQIPKDTSASILTAGLLGEKYVGLEPGGSRTSLADGDQIRFTQSAIVLEQLIGQYMFGQATEGQQQ